MAWSIQVSVSAVEFNASLKGLSFILSEWQENFKSSPNLILKNTSIFINNGSDGHLWVDLVDITTMCIIYGSEL